MDRIDAGAALQHRCDRRDAVRRCIEGVHLGTFRQRGQEGVRAADTGVDEIDLCLRLLDRRGQRGGQFGNIARIMRGCAIMGDIAGKIGGRFHHGRIEQDPWLQRLGHGNARARCPGAFRPALRLRRNALARHGNPQWLYCNQDYYLCD